ncbi:MAG: hypothetical protein IPP34_18320 [Bacteroidetes bacterium]|nr:hypothetical protein [Bacteroidota bacterium]
MGNPGSYESIEFSELKPDSLPLDDYHDRTVELYKVFLGQRKLNLESSALVDMSDVYDDWPKQIEDYKKEVELYTYKFDSVTKVKQDFEKDWFENKRYAVYSLKHKYRAENKLGGMEIYNKQFYLTQNLDSIINCFWCKY